MLLTILLVIVAVLIARRKNKDRKGRNSAVAVELDLENADKKQAHYLAWEQMQRNSIDQERNKSDEVIKKITEDPKYAKNQIPYSDLDLSDGKVIGAGAFGSVYKVNYSVIQKLLHSS